jgi:CRISPR-associated Cas5-like protein
MEALAVNSYVTIWRAVLAFGGVVGIILLSASMVAYTKAARLNGHRKTARISPSAALIGILGAISTLIYTTFFRISDLVVSRPFNAGDVLGVLPVAFFSVASVLLLRDANRILQARGLHEALGDY